MLFWLIYTKEIKKKEKSKDLQKNLSHFFNKVNEKPGALVPVQEFKEKIKIVIKQEDI